MFTSCRPGWVRFHNQLPGNDRQPLHRQSPQQMFSAICKSYFAQIHRCRSAQDLHGSIMPSRQKRRMCPRTMRDACGDPDVDIVLTTREFTRGPRRPHYSLTKLKHRLRPSARHFHRRCRHFRHHRRRYGCRTAHRLPHDHRPQSRRRRF